MRRTAMYPLPDKHLTARRRPRLANGRPGYDGVCRSHGSPNIKTGNITQPRERACLCRRGRRWLRRDTTNCVRARSRTPTDQSAQQPVEVGNGTAYAEQRALRRGKVMATSWLIDDRGHIVTSGSYDFLRSTGVPYSNEMRTYSILNLGFVGVTERQRQVHVQYRPTTISEMAVASLLYYLYDNSFRPVTVTWYGEVWNIERAPNGKVAAEFIKHSLDTIYPVTGRDRIKTRPSQNALCTGSTSRSRFSTSCTT